MGNGPRQGRKLVKGIYHIVPGKPVSRQKVQNIAMSNLFEKYYLFYLFSPSLWFQYCLKVPKSKARERGKKDRWIRERNCIANLLLLEDSQTWIDYMIQLEQTGNLKMLEYHPLRLFISMKSAAYYVAKLKPGEYRTNHFKHRKKTRNTYKVMLPKLKQHILSATKAYSELLIDLLNDDIITQKVLDRCEKEVEKNYTPLKDAVLSRHKNQSRT